MKIYVKLEERIPEDSLYTFLKRILNLENKGYNTGCCKPTFFDPEFKKNQCLKMAHRSFEDIVFISKTYFKVSDKAVARALKKLIDERNFLNFILCDRINKWVFTSYMSKSKEFKYCGTYNKSNEKISHKGKSAYSFEDIIKLMDLTVKEITMK